MENINIEERLNPQLTDATVNIVTYGFRMKFGKKYFDNFTSTPNYMTSPNKLKEFFHKTLTLIRKKQTNVGELIKTIGKSNNVERNILLEVLSLLSQIIPSIAVNIEIMDPIIIELNKETLKTVGKLVNNFYNSPVRPIIILLLDVNTNSTIISDTLKELPINLRVAIHKDSGETEVVTVIDNSGANNIADFMEAYSSQCFNTCCHTDQSILIKNMNDETTIDVVSALLIKCHSHLLIDNKKAAINDILAIRDLLNKLKLPNYLAQLFNCICSLYAVYATDTGGKNMQQAMELSENINNPLISAFVNRYAHFIPNTTYEEKAIILENASKTFEKKGIIDHKLYCRNNMLTYSFYRDSFDITQFNELIGEATNNAPGLSGMSILYTNVGTAELYNRNPVEALAKYKAGLDYATSNNRPAQRIGLLGNIAITEALLDIDKNDNYYINTINDIINMPNTLTMPFIQANGIMNVLASAFYRNRHYVAKAILLNTDAMKVINKALGDGLLGTGSLVEQIKVLTNLYGDIFDYASIRLPQKSSQLSGIRHNYIKEHGFNPAIGNAWL